MWQCLNAGLSYISNFFLVVIHFPIRHPYICFVNLLLLLLHLCVLKPKRRQHSVAKSCKSSWKNSKKCLSSSRQQLGTCKPKVKLDKLPLFHNAAYLEQRPQDPVLNKRTCFPTRLGSSGVRTVYKWDPDLPYKLPPMALNPGLTGFSKLTKADVSESETSTLNEVTWTNEPSSGLLPTKVVSSESPLTRPRWVVDKFSDVPEETEQTTSPHQKSVGLKDKECMGTECRRMSPDQLRNQKNLYCEQGAGHPENELTDKFVCRDAMKSSSQGLQYGRYRGRNGGVNPYENRAKSKLTSKKRYVKRRPSMTQAESDRSCQQHIDVESSRRFKNSGKQIIESHMKDESSIMRKKHMAPSPIEQEDQNEDSRHQNDYHQNDSRYSTEKDHLDIIAKQNQFSKKQEYDGHGRCRERGITERAGAFRETIKVEGTANLTGDTRQTSAEVCQSKRTNFKPSMDPEVPQLSFSDSSGNPVQKEHPKSLMGAHKSVSRLTQPTARYGRHLAHNRSSRRRGMAGVFGCKLTRGLDSKSECLHQSWPNEDLTQIHRSERYKNRPKEAPFPNQQHRVSGSKMTCCRSGSELQVLGNRSDATLIGKRDSWIWFSHEHKPSMEDFASRQRRFHSHDPRVAELADEIRRQEEMNKDIEREAGSIVAMPCIMLGRVHLEPKASLSKLMKDVAVSDSKQPIPQHISCKTSNDVVDKPGNTNRKQQPRSSSHHFPPKSCPKINVRDKSTDVSHQKDTSPAKVMPRDPKNKRPKSSSTSPIREKRFAPKGLQIHRKNKEDGVPGVLLASPMKSSSTSNSLLGHSKSPTQSARGAGRMESNGAKSPSPSPCMLDLHSGRDALALSPNNRSGNKLQDTVALQANRSELEISCASTKVSTTSLLDMGLRSHTTDSCFDDEGQTSLVEHIYSDKSPPKTRQDGRAVESAGESIVSLMSTSQRSYSSKRDTKIALQSIQNAKTKQSPSDKSRPILHGIPTGKDSKIKSPHTQSLTTSTVESSDSMPKEGLATLRQSVLNNEVTDSVHKILFETNNQSCRGRSSIRKVTSISQSVKACSKDGPRKAEKPSIGSELSRPISKQDMHSRKKTHVNVFNRSYYLRKGASCKKKGISQNSQDTTQCFSTRGQRSKSLEDATLLKNNGNKNKALRRSASLQQYVIYPRDDQNMQCGKWDEADLQKDLTSVSDRKFTENTKTETPGHFLNMRPSVSFESNVYNQEGILDVEQPSLQDIESDRRQEIRPDQRVLSKNLKAYNMENEEVTTNDELSSSLESFSQNDIHRSLKEPALFSDNIGENKNGHSSKSDFPETSINASKNAQNLNNPSADKQQVGPVQEIEGIETFDLQLTVKQSNGGASGIEISDEKIFGREIQELSPSDVTRGGHIDDDTQMYVRKSQVDSASFASVHLLTNAQNHKTKEKLERRAKDLTVPVSPVLSNKLKLAKDNSTGPLTNARGKFAHLNPTKRHVPVSALIANVPDIGIKRQSMISNPRKIDAVSCLSSQISHVKKRLKTSAYNLEINSQKSSKKPKTLDKRNPTKHLAQNVSNLRQVHNFYGKRQMRITRSVGLVPPMKKKINRTNCSSGDHLMECDSKSYTKGVPTSSQHDVDIVERCNNRQMSDIDRENEGTVPMLNDKETTQLDVIRDTNDPYPDSRQVTNQPNTSIYTSLRRSSLLSNNTRSSNSSALKSPLAKSSYHKENGIYKPYHSNMVLLEKTTEQFISKNSESRSTNNSSNNLPLQQFAAGTYHVSSVGSVYCINQAKYPVVQLNSPSLAPQSNSEGIQQTKKNICSHLMKTKSHSLASTRGIKNMQGGSFHSRTKFGKRKEENSNESLKNTVIDKIDKKSCNLTSSIHAPSSARFTKRYFICRQNVSSTLRKEHATAKRKDLYQVEKCSPVTSTPFYSIPRTKSLVPRAHFGKEISSFEGERVRGDEMDSIKNLKTVEADTNTSLPSPSVGVKLPQTHRDISNHLPAISNQINSYGDSGFDETLSMSERTRAHTYSLTDKLGHGSAESPYEPPIIVAIDIGFTHLENCIHPIKRQVDANETDSLSLSLTPSTENGEQEHMALKCPSGCVEQETSSINTEEVFTSRANSFWDELDSMAEQKEIQNLHVYGDTPPDSNAEKNHLHMNVRIKTKLHTDEQIEFQSKGELEGRSATAAVKILDSQASVQQSEFGLPAKGGYFDVHPGVRNKQVKTRLFCRKNKSELDLFLSNKPKHFQKSNLSLHSVSPRFVVPLKTNLSYPRKHIDLKTFLACSTMESERVNASVETEIKRNNLSTKTISVGLDRTSPILDCLCVWMSSPCHCVLQRKHSSSSTSSYESQVEAREKSGSKLAPDNIFKRSFIEHESHCAKICVAYNPQNETKNEVNSSETIGIRVVNILQGTENSQQNNISPPKLNEKTKSFSDETEFDETVEAKYEENEVSRLALEAVNVALPPTSSDDEDGEDNVEFLQSRREIENSIIMSVATVQNKGSASSTSRQPENLFSCNKVLPNTCMSPLQVQTDDHPIKTTRLSASFHSEAEEKKETFLMASYKAKTLTGTPVPKPRAKKRRLPGILHDPENKSLETTSSDIETRNDNLQTLHDGTDIGVFLQNKNSLSKDPGETQLPKTKYNPMPIRPESISSSTAAKGVKIGKRSVAFQDLLKRF